MSNTMADEPTPGLLDPNVASVVVGVVSNTHHDGLGGGFDDELYLPMTEKNEQPTMTVLVTLANRSGAKRGRLAPCRGRDRSAGSGYACADDG